MTCGNRPRECSGQHRFGSIIPKPCKHCMAWGVERKIGAEDRPALFSDPGGAGAIFAHFQCGLRTPWQAHPGPESAPSLSLILYWTGARLYTPPATG